MPVLTDVIDCEIYFRRKWIKKFGSGGPPWPKGLDTSLPPRQENPDVMWDIYEVGCVGCFRRVNGGTAVVEPELSWYLFDIEIRIVVCASPHNSKAKIKAILASTLSPCQDFV